MAPPSTTTSVNSPRTNEVNFKRLLQKCEDVVKTAQVIKEPLDGARKRQLSKYVEVLKKQYSELQNMKLGVDTIKAYGKRLDSVIDFEADRKPQNDTELLLERSNVPEVPVITNVPQTPEKSIDSNKLEAFLAPTSPSSELRNRNTKSRITPDDEEIDDTTLEQLIANNEKLQESYSEQMVEYAKALKMNTMEMSKIIDKDNITLGTLDQHVDKNLTNLVTENKKLKEHNTSSWSFTLTLWVVLVFVAMAFMGTYLFMKMFPKRV